MNILNDIILIVACKIHDRIIIATQKEKPKVNQFLLAYVRQTSRQPLEKQAVILTLVALLLGTLPMQLVYNTTKFISRVKAVRGGGGKEV